jgi:predicted MFS family arabinose efflux permease
MALLVYVFLVTMLGTTLPTPLYPDYAHRFGFGQLTETIVFAVYVIGVLATLLLFGRSSDLVGRRPMLLSAVAAAALSKSVFVIAAGAHGGWGVALLVAGRILSGLSAGIMTGTATAALADAAPPGKSALAGLVAALAQICGLGLGPLVGAVIAQYGADPLRLLYLVYLGLLLVAAAALAGIPETVRRASGRHTSFVTPLPVRAILGQANATGLVGFAGFAVLGLFTAVTPSFLDRLGYRAPISTGLVVSSVFAASAVGQLATRRLRPPIVVLSGVVMLAAGMAIVGVGLHAESIAVLEAGGLVAGAGQGMSFRAALSRATASSAPNARGAAASSFFVVCYLGISLPVVGLGALTQAVGVLAAGQAFAALVALLAVATVPTLLRHPAPGTAAPRT